MLDSLILFLLFFLLFLLFLSLIFYYRVKSRQYFFSNKGEPLTYVPSDNFHKLQNGDNDLTFIPFHEDHNRTIRGRIVLTTHSTDTASRLFTVKVMNGSNQLSKSVYRITEGVDSVPIYFSAPPGKDRTLTVDIQNYDPNVQDTTAPTELKLLSASAHYIVS